MKVGDRVNVSLGRAFGGPATITAVTYVVLFDHEQPAGGKYRNNVADYSVTKIKEEPIVPKTRKGKKGRRT